MVDYPDRHVDSQQSFKVEVIDPCLESTSILPRPSRCPVEEIEFEQLDKRMPKWLQELKHSELHLYQSIVIEFGEIKNAFGQEMEVSVELGGASSFIQYRPSGLIVRGESMTLSDVGTWEIIITANDTSFSDDTIVFTKSIYLRVLDPLPKPVASTHLGDHETETEIPTINEEDFTGLIRTGFEPEPETPYQPRPFIIDMTPKGLVTIGWSVEM